MSSLPTFNAANAEGQLNLNYIFSILPFAILYYDYALTFTQEVELFWPIHDRLGWVSSIFLLSRYFAILGNIPILLSYVVNDGSTYCRSIPIFLPFHQGFTLCFISILCSVRVYALYNKSRVALGIVACASFGLTVTGIVTVATSKPVVPLRVSQPIIPGCMSNLVLSPYETERLLFPWSGVLVFDSIVFALTLRKTIQLGTRTHIIQVMFRDGAMYFGVLFLVNLTNILVLRFAPQFLKISMTNFTTLISTTLTSRIMLNLRSLSDSDPADEVRAPNVTTGVFLTTGILEEGTTVYSGASEYSGDAEETLSHRTTMASFRV